MAWTLEGQADLLLISRHGLMDCIAKIITLLRKHNRDMGALIIIFWNAKENKPNSVFTAKILTTQIKLY